MSPVCSSCDRNEQYNKFYNEYVVDKLILNCHITDDVYNGASCITSFHYFIGVYQGITLSSESF